MLCCGKKLIILIVIAIILFVSCESATKSDFKDFMVLSSTNSIFHIKIKPENAFKSGITAKVKIITKDSEEHMELTYYVSKYYFVVVDDFGQGGVDFSATYSIWFNGNEKHQVYGQPLLEIGKEYVLFNLSFNTDITEPMTASYWFDIVEQDGVEYLYPFYMDISDIPDSIKITDKTENQIYKKGKHDDILAYLKKTEYQTLCLTTKYVHLSMM